MSTITREWLQQAINDYESVRDELPFGLDDYQGNILAALRIALASLEAEPVAWKATFMQIDNKYNTFTTMYSDKAEVERWVRLHEIGDFRAEITPLYAAPSAPVIPDGWISCSERMPEKNQNVLISVNFDSSLVEPLICSARYTGSTFRRGEATIKPGNGIEQATHWMPLPEPPQEVNRG
ncbi:DUF551 domain-containing protein [Escherichia coli O51]|uniref:DUF551 domain-containing protein n=2 Tax=Bacteria TaxID=2 RepID=UPI001F12E43E|nr:DUF551 domain-containing protein [Escherichia coli]EFN8622632.1 DUF551 domain-containing protein [Escherichia coli O51]EIF7377889.1 DUF551 domain-containing protein [Escherichia coli]MCH6382512.1 DUF551 domain-containing protein [Escherichia coli]